MKSNSVQATVTIKQDPEKPVEPEVLASCILSISYSFKKLLASGLDRKAIVVLIQDDTGFSKSAIVSVLSSLETLALKYTSK